MAKKLERKAIVTTTPGARAVADLVAAPSATVGGLERVNVVLPKELRIVVERRLLDLAESDRRVSFSGFVEAALREALAGDPAALVDRWNARARRTSA